MHRQSERSSTTKLYNLSDIINKTARFEGDPYRYNPNIVSRRDAKSFRYQIMESYNAMYEAREKTGWKKGNYKEELNLTKILVQHVDEIPKRYTDGHMYGSELAFWLPLLAIVFDNNEINIEKLKTDSGFSGYLKALSKLKEMIAKEPKKVSIKLSKVKTSYYKTISDELLKSSLHSAVYDFLYNMGFPAVKTNESRITETRKSDKALDLINEFCIKHGETLVEYFNIDKDGDYRQMHGVIASKKQSLRSTRRLPEAAAFFLPSNRSEAVARRLSTEEKLLDKGMQAWKANKEKQLNNKILSNL